MLILPPPAPGELAFGYWGRLKRVNLFATPTQTIRTLVRHFDVRQHQSQKAFALAHAAAMEPVEFFRLHTLLPYRVSPLRQSLEESRGYRRGSHRGATLPILELSRPRLYFCPKCVQIQQVDIGYSCWRCEHQLPGLHWCHEHEEALYSVEGHWALEASPSLDLPIRCTQPGTEFSADGTLRRFGEISVGLLRRSKGPGFGRARTILSLSRYWQAQPLVSDRAAEEFPKWWLESEFPGFGEKVRGEPFPAIDAFLTDGEPIALAVALTLLRDTADEALNWWLGWPSVSGSDGESGQS